MVLKNVLIAVIGATLVAWSGVSIADEYRPDEFLGLDLSRAVLSPKPLGPAAGFAPGPLDVSVDRAGHGVLASVQPAAEPKIVVTHTRVVHATNTRVVHARAEPPQHLHRNPVDAQAFDARIQVWPCRSGGICNWKR